MKYLYLIIVLLLAVGSFPLRGQGKIRFAYDAAGNRIRRELVIGGKKPKGLRSLSQDSTQQATHATSDTDSYATEKIGEGRVRIYPNPTEGALTIEFLDYRPDLRATLVVYDLSGRVVDRRVVASVTTLIDLSSQRAGFYLLHLLVGRDRSVWKIRKN